jgi:hypothetical protein
MPSVDVVALDRLGGYTDDWRIDEGVLAQVRACLVEHRFALLTGRRELGKACVALAAAGQLLEDIGVNHSSIYRVRDLAADCSFDPAKPDLGCDISAGGVIIVKDAVEGDNQDLLRFLKRLDKQALTGMTEALAKAELFLILTVADNLLDAKLSTVSGRLASLGVRISIPLPTVKQLVWTWTRTAARLSKVSRIPIAPPPDEGVLIELQTHPRITRFFDVWVAAASGQSTPPTVQQVLAQLDDSRAWMEAVRSSPNQSEWYAALALLLGLSISNRPYVPWNEFYCLLEQVAAALAPPSSTPLARTVTMPNLDPIRAHLRNETGPFPRKVVAFKEVQDGTRLWQALLDNDPLIASRLLSHFLVVAAGEVPQSSDVDTRRLAARVIGKLCTHNPSLVVRRAQEWLSDNSIDMMLLGELAQGVVASGDDLMRTHILEVLLERRPDDVLTAMLLYTLPILSLSDFGGAIFVFRKTVARNLRKDVSNLAALNKGIRESRLVAAQARQAGDAALQTYFQEFHGLLTERYFAVTNQNFLMAIQECLAFLCFFGGGVEVMHDLFTNTNQHVHPLVTGLFIGPGGVAQRAAEGAESLAAEDGSPLKNPFLLSLKVKSGAVEQMTDVVLRLDKNIDFFPKDIRSAMRKQLLNLLLRWMRKSVADPHIANKLVAVFRRLLNHRKSSIADDLEGELKAIRQMPDNSDRLRRMATRALL